MARWTDCYEVERTGPDVTALVLHVHVQPGAGRTAVVGRHGDAVKLRVAAPPLDDRANREVCEVLADVAGIASAGVGVVSGERSRVKRVRLPGVEPEDLERAIDAAIEQGSGPPRRRR